jgi:hypothetical protein
MEPNLTAALCAGVYGCSRLVVAHFTLTSQSAHRRESIAAFDVLSNRRW